jgi:molybdopterin/thiamine biosynthesis adenylyltransferase/rhodanese-related sulfurtransferase
MPMKREPWSALEVSATEAAREASRRQPLIDIRSGPERLTGIPRGAVHRSVAELLEECRAAGSDEETGGFLLCTEGVRSREAVERLLAQGYGGFRSVAGGFQAWQEAGLAASYPEGLAAEQAQRYARHLVMPQVGPAGQRSLLRSRVLLAGIGGLNAPAALYLAAAGVGRLGLVDPDSVERSNLQRQVIHAESTLGWNKAASAECRLRDLNPDIEIEVIEERIRPDNAADVVSGWDIVIDGTDNFAARYALNQACVGHGKPLVYGAVMQFQGQVSVFWPRSPERLRAGDAAQAPCFACLLPEPPAPEATPGCAVAGVLGVIPGIVGTLQANEALKLALGIGQPLIGRLLMLDGLGMEFREARVKADPRCPVCGLR